MDLQERIGKALPTIRDWAPRTDEDARFPAESVDALAETGLLGVAVPEDRGGTGGGPQELVQAVTSVASACGSTAMVYLMHLAACGVVATAPPAGGEALLGEMASGRRLGTLAFSEKGSRSHFWAPVSRAEAAGPGRVRIEAAKSWVTSASHAGVLVTSTGSVESTEPAAVDMYAVERDTPGVEVAGGFDGLGLRGNDSAPVSLTVEVDEGARLGMAGAGFGLMMEAVLPVFNLGNAAVSVGLARAALDAATDHVVGARFDHLDSTLADLPTIRAYLAKAWADVQAHEAFLRETAGRVAQPDDGTVVAVTATKASCNEMALRVTETALRVAGGAAFSRQVGIDRPYRDARAGFVMAPTSDALWDLTGRALCGMELF